MDDIRSMFLRQSLWDCQSVFAQSLAHTDAPAWDYLVITAANETQAAAYRAQVNARLSAGQLPRQTRYLVIPDPDGRRVGSGGATLNVMRELDRAEGGTGAFAQKRVLVLHSGGDGQRAPQYSACGKLFSRVPRALPDGRASTLFDEFCISLSGMPNRVGSGMLVLSGDVLLLFNALQIDLENRGAACLSFKAPVETGSHHGVFLPGEGGVVRRFLHKQPVETLRRLGAVNEQGMVDIDTGAVWLDEERVRALYGLIPDEASFARFVNEEVRLSFYGDFIYPMAEASTLEEYLRQAPENAFSPALDACRRAIWQALGGTTLALLRLAPAEFIHFGTTRQWRALLLEGEERFGCLGWRRSVVSAGAGKEIAAINSLLQPGAQVGEGSAVEDSIVRAGARVGRGCVVSNADLEETLPDGAVLHVLPVDGGTAFCARLYGVEDNPKEAKWFGRPIDQPLWTAPIHPVCATARGAVRAALCGEPAERRMSLKESFGRASLEDLLAWQRRVALLVRQRRVQADLEAGRPVTEVLALLYEGGSRLEALLRERAETAPFPLNHRLYYALAQARRARGEEGADALEDGCWRAVNDHLLAAARAETAVLPPARIVCDRAECALPVRVNWGGGWSDTPPYCLEFGGAVLNAAVLLDGRNPVRAWAERLEEPVVRIESLDLGVRRDYTRLEELATGNPHDAHALCKAALAVCGVTGEEGPATLAERLRRIGGGICLRTAVENVPKGSGLGTSSILCAAVVRALSRLLGQPEDDARVASLALCMEQLMNTGGGWQDQAGGLLPGIKLISTHPGTPQRLAWRSIAVPDAAFAALQRRHALVFTGQRRMARNILREIMGKAVARDQDTLRVLSAIQRLAVLMAFELETGDLDSFGRLLWEHWALSKRLDPGSSNTCIDHMIAVCTDLIDGVMICGAGGGGFLSMLLKDGVTRADLRDRLAGVFQESGVRVWNAELAR